MHVATLICYVTMTLFCIQQISLSRPSFSGRDITFIPSARLHVATHISCHDKTFLCSADLCFCDLICYVVTWLLCISFLSVQLILVLRPEDLNRDIKTLFHLERCRNFDSPCFNQVSSSIKHPLSRPSLLVAPETSSSASFMSQQTFPCFRSQCRDRRGFCRDRYSAFSSALSRNTNYLVPNLLAYVFPILYRDLLSFVAT